jgi:hypothetical protein
MPEPDLTSIGLDALDAHEAEEAKKGDGGTDPVDPVDPVDPQDPTDPVDPADPQDPPADPVDPVDPDPVVEPPKEEKVANTTPLDEFDTVDGYINAKLPEIEIRGSDGDDGEIKVYKVKNWKDLPEDFVPESHRDMLAASEQFGKNGAKAEELAKEYSDLVSEKVQQEFRTELEQGWLKEIDELVADKRLQPIQAKENTDAYSKDPTVQRITQISDFMIKENDRLAKAGNPYRIQSVKQALDLMEASEQREQAKKDKDDAAKREAELIKQRGGMVGGGDSSTSKTQKPRVRPGETIDDILARHDELE